MTTTRDEVDKLLEHATRLAADELYDDALGLLIPLRNTYPRDPRVLGVLGGVLWRQGKLKDARDCFRAVTLISPRSELASVGLFHCLWDLGARQEAKDEIVRFLTQRDSEQYRSLLEEMGWSFRAGKLHTGEEDDE